LGNIVSLSTYADVTRLGGTIVDGPASNVRIITGGASGNTTVGANATINSLTNNSTGGVATVDLGTNTLNLGVAAALLSASGTTGMTLQNGTLTAGGTTGTAGELLVINNSATATILDAAIANNGAGVVKLTQTGTGVLTLKQANTFTGDTTTYGGTLNLSNGSALQNSTLNYSAGALVFDQSVATNTFTLGSLSGTKAVALLNNATTPAAITLTVGGNNANAIYSGVLSGTGGSLTKTGIGTLVLTGVNTYTGATTVSGGTLQIGDGVTNGSLSSTTGIDTTGGTLRYSQTNASATTVPAWANITGSGTVSLAVAGTSTTNRQWGGGNYTLASGFTGSLQIDSGRLSINANGFGGTTAVSVQNGGQLALFAGGTYANTINFSIAGSGYGEGSYESALRLGDTAATTINGTVTLTGDATIATGKSSGTGATATFNGGIGETGGARNLTLGTGSTGTGDAKGTYVFNAANTYTGDTTVTAGSLRVNNITGSGTGTGAVSVAAGALLGGSGSIGGAVNVTGVLAPGNSIESLATGSVTMNSGSSLGIEIQDTTGVGADLLAINGDLTLNGTVTLDLTKIGIGTWAANDKLTLASYTGTWNGGLFSVGGIAIADGGLFSTSDNQSWTLDYNDTVKGNNFAGDANGPSYVTMTAIPEPASILLGGLGLLTLLRRRRK
ncbi:MAG: autotransporter-associated beta strand repeat-containing protein, partial [Luteolibacter sp.]